MQESEAEAQVEAENRWYLQSTVTRPCTSDLEHTQLAQSVTQTP